MSINRAMIVRLGVVSGGLSAAIPAAVLPGLAFVPGIAFGLLVMIPWAKGCHLSLGAAVMCGLLSVCGYCGAFLMCQDSNLILAPMGAAIGTMLTVLPGLFAGQEVVRRASFKAILIGSCAAVIFPVADATRSFPLLFLGIAAWQVAVASVLGTALDK